MEESNPVQRGGGGSSAGGTKCIVFYAIPGLSLTSSEDGEIIACDPPEKLDYARECIRKARQLEAKRSERFARLMEQYERECAEDEAA